MFKRDLIKIQSKINYKIDLKKNTPNVVYFDTMNKLEGFEKIGTFILNHSTSKTLIRMQRHTSTGRDTRRGSHVYLLVVNDIIKKIGCSVTNLTNYAGYGVGNAGQPSDRTTGIHYYIARELYLGKVVDFYAQMCPYIEKVTLNDMYGTEKVHEDKIYIDPKIVENFHLKGYKERFGDYPEWNMQEKGRNNEWEESIKKINNAIKTGVVIPYQSGVESDILMKLYHWKYNNISL